MENEPKQLSQHVTAFIVLPFPGAPVDPCADVEGETTDLYHSFSTSAHEQRQCQCIVHPPRSPATTDRQLKFEYLHFAYPSGIDYSESIVIKSSTTKMSLGGSTFTNKDHQVELSGENHTFELILRFPGTGNVSGVTWLHFGECL